MKKGYGDIHYSVLFLDKIVARADASSSKALLAYRIASALLRHFDALQCENPLVTLSFATDSLRVYFSGQLQFHIQARKHRSIIWIPGGFSPALRAQIHSRPDIFPVEAEHISWIVTAGGIEWLFDYLRHQWASQTNLPPQSVVTHTREIPGNVRQAALSEFLNMGRWCPGVFGITKRHRLGDDDRIEFDHILPHSAGGSNSYWNVQVMCAECNRIKRATAR